MLKLSAAQSRILVAVALFFAVPALVHADRPPDPEDNRRNFGGYPFKYLPADCKPECTSKEDCRQKADFILVPVSGRLVADEAQWHCAMNYRMQAATFTSTSVRHASR
jgi:hypothetical protein